jgi:hypothetical protein
MDEHEMLRPATLKVLAALEGAFNHAARTLPPPILGSG